MHSIKPFTTGCGVFRVKISQWSTDSSAIATTGFEIGLCDSSPDTWTTSADPTSIPDSKKTYAIRAFQPTSNFHIKTKTTGADFVGANPQVFPSNDGAVADPVGVNADIIELSIQGENIVGTIFKNGQANGDVLFIEPYKLDSNGNPVPLFGYLAFHGARNNIEITD